MDEIKKLWAKIEALRTLAKKENRDLTDAEDAQLNSHMDEIELVEARIKTDTRAAELEARLHAPVTEPIKPDPDATQQRVQVNADLEAEKPFASFGEQARAIMEASTPNGKPVDKRLLHVHEVESRAIGTGSKTSQPSEGGFLLDSKFSNELWKRTYENSAVLSRCQIIPLEPNVDSIEISQIDETSRVDGSRMGGVQAYWIAELDQLTETRPKFERIRLEPQQLVGLYYASDKLLRSIRSLEADINTMFTDEFDFKIQDALIRGNGAGMPLGILNSECLVAVAIETGQAAKTIQAENIINMRSRLYAKGRKNSVWLINQDCEPQLTTMSIAVGTGGVPVYLPATGLADDGYDRLYGRPVVPIEQCQTVGTAGDLILADFSQYVVATKGGINSDMSIHLKFDYLQTAFRWVMELDGQPRWGSALTPFKGGSTKTVSPFIDLAVRE